MKVDKLRSVLKSVNEVVGLDFVSHTMGTCCNSCAEFRTAKLQKQWDEAETYVAGKWFSSGMNYRGPLKDFDELAFNWDMSDEQLDMFCTEVARFGYDVTKPIDRSKCIVIRESR